MRQYQLYLLNEKKLAAQTVKVRMSALRFFYWKTLKRRDLFFDDLPLPKTPKKLPAVLSSEEVIQLIEGASSLMHRTILILLYATGIRRAELRWLKLSNIDSKRMVIHIEQGKGRRDRALIGVMIYTFVRVGADGCACMKRAARPIVINGRTLGPVKASRSNSISPEIDLA